MTEQEVDALAMRITRDCVRIVDLCLTYDEQRDAVDGFYTIIRKQLRRLEDSNEH